MSFKNLLGWSLLAALFAFQADVSWAQSGDAKMPADEKRTSEGESAEAAKAAGPSSQEVRFDPRRMPETAPVTPPLGYRYGDLSRRQTRALRRNFKLPMEALEGAKSTSDLRRAAIVFPLPDPRRPMLPVEPQANGMANPFTSTTRASFRDDPMGALGQLLGVTEADLADSSDPGASESSSPFQSGSAFAPEAEQPAAAPSSSPDPSNETPAANDDPFATDGDSEDDPFGF